ncbi:STM3941 family protein [Taibaiella koreensis]|uniref:STM3941 family protein n=1 Tax=Taibaiella koreensis TaxID=1268548 RepID=UPI000E59ED83|nr:STM3941 family protein [Taibaiella koreensis]
MENETVILLSRKKMLLLVIGASIFVVIGFWGTIRPGDLVSLFRRNAEMIRLFSLAALLFFGLCWVYAIRKLFDKKPGLIIDQYGITNNTNAVHTGLIVWDDIVKIERREVAGTRFLIVYISNPDRYIKEIKDAILKRAAIMSLKTYGSPVSITANALKMDFDDLEQLITSVFERRKSLSDGSCIERRKSE